MTNLEILKGSINGDFTDAQLQASLIKQGLKPTDTYVIKNEVKIDFCWAALLFSSIGTLKSTRELDYAVEAQSIDDIMKAIKAIYDKWGLPNPYANNKVRGSKIW